MRKKLNPQDKRDLSLMVAEIKKDPAWDAVSKEGKSHVPYREFCRIRCRIIKKALEVIYREYKISVRQGAGTARNWINVKIALSKKPIDGKSHCNVFCDKTLAVQDRANRLLDSLPIRYSTYLTDYGRNDYNAPCISVHCQSHERMKTQKVG